MSFVAGPVASAHWSAAPTGLSGTGNASHKTKNPQNHQRVQLMQRRLQYRPIGLPKLPEPTAPQRSECGDDAWVPLRSVTSYTHQKRLEPGAFADRPADFSERSRGSRL